MLTILYKRKFSWVTLDDKVCNYYQLTRVTRPAKWIIWKRNKTCDFKSHFNFDLTAKRLTHLSPVFTTRVDSPSWRVTGFHYPSTWAVLTGAFPLAELTGRVDGSSIRLVETCARQHDPCWRVMETGHPSTRAVNSGSGNRALVWHVWFS